MRICDPLLPVFAREFDTTLAAAAATTTGFAVAYGATQLFFGPLGDRIGRLPVIVAAIAIAAAASVLSAVAGSLDLLIASRILTGAFAAAAIPLSLAWIADTVPFAGRQPVLARYLIGQMLGMTGGQIGGGILADWIGWRAAFWVVAAIFAGASLMLLRSMRPARDAVRAGAPPKSDDPARGHAPRAAPPAGFLRQTALLFSDRWAATVLLAASLEGMFLFGAVALIASYLQRVFAVSPSIAGTVTALFGLGGIVYAVNARRLLGRLRSAGLARAGGGCFAAAMLLLIALPGWQPAILATLMAGLGYYMLHNTLQNQATQLSTEARGAALAWFASGLWLGQGIGVSLAAIAAERFGFHAVFAVSGLGLVVIGLAFGRAVARREAGVSSSM